MMMTMMMTIICFLPPVLSTMTTTTTDPDPTPPVPFSYYLTCLFILFAVPCRGLFITIIFSVLVSLPFFCSFVLVL